MCSWARINEDGGVYFQIRQWLKMSGKTQNENWYKLSAIEKGYH